MVVWESGFSCLAISKKADLWRQNSKLSYLFYSFIGCPACTSPGFLILGWLSLSSLLILPPYLTLPHFWYTFWLWFSFLRAEEQKKNTLVFLFSSPSSTQGHMIRFSCSRFRLEVFWTSWSYLVTWKTREWYYIWGKGKISYLERRFHAKGCGLMRVFVAGKGSVEVLGSKVNGEGWEHRWNHLTFTLPLYPCGQRVFIRPFILEAHHIGSILGCRGFLVTLW